jgi:hypothetical protein
MIAERSASADLHLGASDRVAIAIGIDRLVGAAQSIVIGPLALRSGCQS